MRLDLNAKRAARAAQRGEPIEVQIGEDVFTLPYELPMEAAELLGSNDIVAAMKLIIAPKDWEKFISHEPTVFDLADIATFYGAQLGELLASVDSSANTGAQSRPTLSAITA